MRLKEQYPDHILFFRLGDFYEMFYEDAKTASRELELTLTGRDCGEEERAPMCGIPYHACEPYIGRLISRGYKVAICEQVGDVTPGKGLMERRIVRVITPGTVFENTLFDEKQNNYLSTIYYNKASDRIGLCFCDISSATVSATSFPLEDESRLINEPRHIHAERNHYKRRRKNAASHIFIYRGAPFCRCNKKRLQIASAMRSVGRCATSNLASRRWHCRSRTMR